MATPYIGEIKLFAGNFAPVGWAFCNGQLLAISENDALFSLIGTTYGGDGQQTFALPDLRGRVPLHFGSGTPLGTFIIGEAAGTESVTLTTPQIPAHQHQLRCDPAPGTSGDPAGNAVAGSPLNMYAAGTADTNMGAGQIGAAGGNQPHDNIMPYQCVSFIIAIFGIYPTQTRPQSEVE